MSEPTLNTIYNENCLNTMARMPDEFVDSIVTDPPYGLSFMGKKWDYEVPSVDIWQECLRVLKPGGYLLSFAGTRTQHRMACNIEDAGFEIRDMIAWVYGSGFPKSLNVGKSINSLETKEWLKIDKALDNIEINNYIAVWKNNLNNVKFVGTQSEKNQIEIGICMLKSDSVQVNVPANFNHKKSYVSAIIAELNLCEVPLLQTETRGLTVTQNVEANIKQSQDRVRYVGKLSQNQNHKLWNIFTAQCNVKELLKEKTNQVIRVEEALMTLRGNQKYSESEIISVLCVVLTDILKHTILNQSKTFQNLDTNLQTECVSAINVTITESIAECLITNTVNIAKQITVDKLQGNERVVIGDKLTGGIKRPAKALKSSSEYDESRTNNYTSGQTIVPNTLGASKWEGWGTALKPALEPITVARKPLSEKTVAENVLKWGTGGINIDGCRVETEEVKEATSLGGKFAMWNKDGDNKGFTRHNGNGTSHELGRFPANFIHDGSDEVVSLFPNTKSGGGNKANIQPKNRDSQVPSTINGGAWTVNEGSAARFFYCAKASKAERNRGCEELEKKIGGGMKGTEDKTLLTGSGNIRNNLMKNNHATVKPIALMQYLIKLVTPENGIVLDPFMGSGTTGIACVVNNFNFIGCELSKEYCDIARKRINNELAQFNLFESLK